MSRLLLDALLLVVIGLFSATSKAQPLEELTNDLATRLRELNGGQTQSERWEARDQVESRRVGEVFQSFWTTSLGIDPIGEPWLRNVAARPPWPDAQAMLAKIRTGYGKLIRDDPNLVSQVRKVRNRTDSFYGLSAKIWMDRCMWIAVAAEDSDGVFWAARRALDLIPAENPDNVGPRVRTADTLTMALAELPLPSRPLVPETSVQMQALQVDLLETTTSPLDFAWYHMLLHAERALQVASDRTAKLTDRWTGLEIAIAEIALLESLEIDEDEWVGPQIVAEITRLKPLVTTFNRTVVRDVVWDSALRVWMGPYSDAMDDLLRCHLAAVAIAVHRYAADHQGSLPRRLEDLVPKYLSHIPFDPTSEPPMQPIRAVLSGSLPRLYGLGRNSLDNGGHFDAEPFRRPADAARDRTFKFQPLDRWNNNLPEADQVLELIGTPSFGIAATPFGPCHVMSRVVRSRPHSDPRKNVLLSPQVDVVRPSDIEGDDVVIFLRPPLSEPEFAEDRQ